MNPPVHLERRAGEGYRVRVEPASRLSPKRGLLTGRPFVGDSSPEAFTEREILRGRANTAAPRSTAWSAHRARARAR